MIKNNFRILKKPHANLQTIAKAPVKFQKDWPKTVGGVEGTRYLLKIRNHAPRTTHYALRTTHYALRKAENNVPPLFFEKAGDNKMTVRPAKTQISLGIRPVWSESSLCAQWVAKDPTFLRVDSEASDQTGRMPRLIWVFARRTLILLVLSWGGSNIEMDFCLK